VFNLASYTAPSSIAGKTVVCNVSDGLYPFASSGSFTLYVSASGNSYTTDSQGQSGTYSYSLVNRSTGKLQLSDSKAGSFVVYVGFSDALNGGFATTQASTGGFQVGSFQIVPTRIISLGGNLAFGSVTVGASARSTLTINNTGNSITTISSISYPSGFSGNWSGKISAGSSQPVTVTFSPSSATNYGGTVTVNSDMTSGVNTITASGTGVPTYVSVTVQANSTGRSFGVDGANYTKAQTFSWVSGSRHTIATSSPQNGGTGIQYVWSNWSDGGALSHIVSPTNGTTYTANFTTQYFLTMNAGTGGGVSPASGWYDSGTSVPIAAATNTCNSFSGWTGSGSGSYTGTNNPAGVVMDGAVSETANFAQISYRIATTNSPSGSGTTSGGGTKACGANVTVTATAGSGFRFANWTEAGTVVATTNTLTFAVTGNRSLVANFIDIQVPTNSITSPTSGQRWSNAVFTVTGTARDNAALSSVWYQLNGSGWNLASSANNWTNWGATNVTLLPGTNLVQAYAVDTSGNLSVTNSVRLDYVVTKQLGVRAIGLGTLSPNYSNSWLEVGRNYSMTAKPGSGFVFTNWTVSTNWTGALTTNNATVQFVMQTNLTLRVNFVETNRPIVTITSPTAGQKMTNALANVKGTASDKWQVGGVLYQLNSGAWGLATSTNGWTNWTVVLPLMAGTNVIKAYAVNLGGNVSTTNSVSVESTNTFNLRLGFGSQQMTSDGLQLSLEVSLGISGRIEVSTNLEDWTTLTNFASTNATMKFRDSTVTNYHWRFYRAVVP
jgi:hypothetical protein